MARKAQTYSRGIPCKKCGNDEWYAHHQVTPTMTGGPACRPCLLARGRKNRSAGQKRADSGAPPEFIPPKRRELPPERERIERRKARQGHGTWKNDLLKAWGRRCAVTGGTQLLVGSHSKPHNRCSREEQLDPYNGLPLVPALDALYNAGWLTFLPDGTGVLHPDIDPALYLPITPLRLRHVAPEHQKYLEYHRHHIYKGDLN